MPKILCFFATALIVSPKSSRADKALAASSGGYLGRYAIGMERVNESRAHFLTVSLGLTPDELAGNIHQLNVLYIFSPWRSPIRRSYQLHPVGVGLFLAATNRREFAARGSDLFGDGDYDQSALRPGLIFNSRLEAHRSFGAFRVGPFVSVLDIGLKQIWNNGWTNSSLNYFSAGIAIAVGAKSSRPFSPDLPNPPTVSKRDARIEH